MSIEEVPMENTSAQRTGQGFVKYACETKRQNKIKMFVY